MQVRSRTASFRAFLIAAAGIAFFGGVERLPAREPIPDKLVVLTFDDSSRSHYTVVRPLLKKLGFGATFFITEGFDFKDNKRDYMTWDEIRQLHDDGFEIGNHTRDHFTVNANNVERLREQIEAITVRCREHGIPDPVSFAYPGNGIDARAFPILRESGIQFARRGGAPEFPYDEGRGVAYEPGRDHPLLIPSAGDARPGWTLSDLRRAVEPAKDGRIAVLQFHGAPDTAHQWVNLPPWKFEPFMNHLKVRGYRVIALRDLAKYVDPSQTPEDAFAVIEQRRERRRAGVAIVHPGDGAEMVYVPAGEFVLGLNADDVKTIARHHGIENIEAVKASTAFPRAAASIEGFFIDKDELTLARWKKFVDATQRRTRSARAREALENSLMSSFALGDVDWEEAAAYAKWSGKALPNERQWEKAARGSDGFLYPWGDSLPSARSKSAAPREKAASSDAPEIQSDETDFSPYGALDLLSGMAEWTADRMDPNKANDQDAASQRASDRDEIAVRGGTWDAEDGLPLYAAMRKGRKPDQSHPSIGFRTVWIPPKGYFDSPQFRRDQLAFEQKPIRLGEGAQQAWRSSLRQVDQLIKGLPEERKFDAADAAVFTKALAWALRYDAEFTAADRKLMDRAVVRARDRALAIGKGRQSWLAHRGKKVHGYTSSVDGSAQPYGLVVPANYDPKTPMRLDVVLHGSTKPVGMSELRFMARFDEGDDGAGFVPDAPYIELHPLGRVENCYRWAGETDVFEAIADCCRRYNIDRSRIVLRGMSMGASGTWHLGLKHPGFFAALGPYCGYVDTHRFSETPLPSFIKVGPLPEHQELGLHMLDSVDYAANAGVVPVVAAIGEKDVFFDAHVLMGAAFQKEGIPFVNLISPGTGHVIDPVTHAEQLKRIAEHLTQRGRPIEASDQRVEQHAGPIPPSDVRFVTWTLKYARSHWIELRGLEKHYQRAEIRAKSDAGVVDVAASNITRFAILPDRLASEAKAVKIGSTEIPLPRPKHSDGVTRPFVFDRDGATWRLLSESELAKDRAKAKRPGLQGPIDDAFASPFLCVRPTGKPWNAETHAAALARLESFRDDWRQYFRGECPVKDDVEVTDADFRGRNLILFGDPGSNVWIAKSLEGLPIRWTRETLTMNGVDYPSSQHLPALIQPNPLMGGEGQYLVINSGHTFGSAELSKLNYLLFPRWGDWAALRVSTDSSDAKGSTVTPVAAGYFNERWDFEANR